MSVKKYLTDKEEEDYLKSQQFVKDTKRIIMENREYYTPEISELFVGYKCQRRVTKPNYVEKYLYEWRDYTVDEHYFSVGYEEGQDWNYDEVELRTPYLGKQNIIDLGWEIDIHRAFFEVFKDTSILEIATKTIGDKVYILIYHKPNKWLTIKMQDLSGSWKEDKPICTIYYGNCKCKNMLKKLMKDYLNIHI